MAAVWAMAELVSIPPCLLPRRPLAESCAVPRLANARPLLRPLAISPIGGEIPTRAVGRGAAEDSAPSAENRPHSRDASRVEAGHLRDPTDAGAVPRRSRYHHQPVMLAEVLQVLSEAPEGVLLDATLGGGGHAEALLDANHGLRLVGIDRDPDALRAAAARLARHSERVRLHHARFDDLQRVLDESGHREIAACLFDLGVSSAQLDQPERGFSYRHDGPLDMRMDPAEALTAAEIVNGWDHQALADLLKVYADERYSRRIAAAVVAARPLRTTAELARVVASAVPSTPRRRGHPARRTFQALRIQVNAELEILEAALSAAIGRLAGGGRIAVLSYHSGEDRIVKSLLRREAGEAPGARLPMAAAPVARVRLVGRRSRTPDPSETMNNPRASAARLRVAQRLFEDE